MNVDQHSGRYAGWFKVAVAVMAPLAAAWLSYEVWRLLWQGEPLGAIDLRLRFIEVNAWFAGRNVYAEVGTAVYPPASYALFWPFLGWPSWKAARWIWAIASFLGLAWLVYLAVNQSLAASKPQRFFIALVPLSAYATGAALGNGQPLLVILPALIACTLLLELERSWSLDLACAALFIWSALKPSVAAPFFWIVLFRPGRLRPAVLVLAGYLALTLIAASCQPQTPVRLMVDWWGRALAAIEHTRAGVARAAATDLEIANGEDTGAVRPKINLDPWSSFVILFGAGIWFYKFRKADLWLLLAVAGFAARFWIYHRWYDDILLILPAITLFRIGRHEVGVIRTVSDVLLTLLILSLLAPGGLYALSGTPKAIYLNAQLAIWMTVLIFLVWFTYKRTTNCDGKVIGA